MDEKVMYFVYILSNKYRTVLYIGVTNNLKRRLYEHEHHLIEGFTKKYNVSDLIYFEESEFIESAIAREKQLKRWSRNKKEILIKQINPSFQSLNDLVYQS